jgi:hypothetical protein
MNKKGSFIVAVYLANVDSFVVNDKTLFHYFFYHK